MPPAGRNADESRPGISRSPYADFVSEALPDWMLIKRRVQADEIENVPLAVRSALASAVDAIEPGERICLAVGSRGIDRLAEAIAATVETIRQRGATVFVVPAMGSHGGATADGQRDVLSSLGVTEAAVGCEIRSTMETVLLGTTPSGVEVHVDRIAATEADQIVPINRIKLHTDFSGPVQSGLLKMIAIGLGKQRGADIFHREGFRAFGRLIPEVAAYSLQRLKIPFGLALLENENARLRRIEAVGSGSMIAREPELLVESAEYLARLPVRALDVLVIDQIGKDVSGLGMDSNVIGRYYTGPIDGPSIQRIVVRGLTDKSAGNAVGLGLADIALRGAVDHMDPISTYLNCVTAKTPEGARVPLTVENDREALQVALACCVQVQGASARVMRIVDTKHLEYIFASEATWAEVLESGSCEAIGEPGPIRFDEVGRFTEGFPT